MGGDRTDALGRHRPQLAAGVIPAIPVFISWLTLLYNDG